MRDPARIRPLLERLAKVWEKHPDQRLGQLIVNSCSSGESVYCLECEEIVKNLEEWFDTKPKVE